MTTTTGSSGLDALFRPRTIAVIGASDDPRKIGGRPIRYMLEAKTTATLYPVNPTRSEIQGLQAWPSAESIPGGIDQAIIAVPASMAEKAVADACAAKASAIVMFTGGFAEAGEEGAEAQRRIVELVRKSGARLLGPNSIGAFNTADRTFSTFASHARLNSSGETGRASSNPAIAAGGGASPAAAGNGSALWARTLADMMHVRTTGAASSNRAARTWLPIRRCRGMARSFAAWRLPGAMSRIVL